MSTLNYHRSFLNHKASTEPKLTRPQIIKFIVTWLDTKKIAHGLAKENDASILFCCVRGKPLAIDIKTHHDEITDEQFELQQRWNDHDGLYLIARNLRTVIDCIERILVHAQKEKTQA